MKLYPVILLGAALLISGCATTNETPAETPANATARKAKSEPGRKSVGSNIRKRSDEPTVSAAGRISGEDYSQQMKADQVNATGEQIINSRNQ